jgi:hypothetical protein
LYCLIPGRLPKTNTNIEDAHGGFEKKDPHKMFFKINKNAIKTHKEIVCNPGNIFVKNLMDPPPGLLTCVHLGMIKQIGQIKNIV